MCFSPKIKMPKVNTQQVRAIEPAPLTQEVSGVQFGGMDDSDKDTESTEVSGRKGLTIKKDDSVAKSQAGNGKSKSSIRKGIFGGKR